MKKTRGKLILIFLSLMLMIIASGTLALPAYAETVKSVSTEAALQSAVANGGSIKLTKSLTLSSGIVIPSDVTVTLDLNGKTLDRNLTECVDLGSTIRVEPNATLTITDSTGTNNGVITGGASWNGGGICNHGTLTIEGGTITGNKALHDSYGGGGGIYNGSYNGSVATLTIKGGIISNNRAREGGGIYNGSGGTLTLLEGTRLMKKGAKKVTVYDNVVITDNKVTYRGSGIFNAETINLQDTPEIYNNNTKDNIFLAAGKMLTFTGELKSTHKMTVQADGTNPVFTANYSLYNAKAPETFFVSATTDAVIMYSEQRELLLKTDSNTVVQVFSDNTLTKSENYASVEEAWNKAVSYSSDAERVEITLGSDWEHDRQLKTAEDDKTNHLVLDLNGHYIKRTRNFNKTSDGEVFYVPKGCTFTIKDSNPNRKGYDGLKGGVICGGASTNGAGGIHLKEKTTLNMLGGTLYECVTNSDGGGIKAFGNDITINMKDCAVVNCQTFDATGWTNGGGIYLYDNTKLTMENVLFEDCYSEDYGGAIYAKMENGAQIYMKNCSFIGNKAYDYGGALYMKDIKSTCNFRADGCKFLNNSAGDYGGALDIRADKESEDATKVEHSPMVFNDCLFKANKAELGSAIYLYQINSVVLYDCTVTDNHASNYGGVYVTSGDQINLGGVTVIKDNTAEKKTGDLYLHTNGYATNVYSTGLEPGAYISVDLDGLGHLSNRMSEYQMMYFHPTEGELTFEKTTSVDAPFITASVFSNGSVIIIAVLGAVVLITAAAAVIWKKKKGGLADDSEDE